MGAESCREMGKRGLNIIFDGGILMHVDAEAKDDCRVFGGC